MSVIDKVYVDGGYVKVDDYVGFKSEITYYGKVMGFVRGNKGIEVIIRNMDGFVGGDLDCHTVANVTPRDCWLEA